MWLRDVDDTMEYLEPELHITGSVSEGTRMGVLSEMDVTLKFKGLKKPFRVNKSNALELLISDEDVEALKRFCKNGDVFDYPLFLDHEDMCHNAW